MSEYAYDSSARLVGQPGRWRHMGPRPRVRFGGLVARRRDRGDDAVRAAGPRSARAIVRSSVEYQFISIAIMMSPVTGLELRCWLAPARRRVLRQSHSPCQRIVQRPRSSGRSWKPVSSVAVGWRSAHSRGHRGNLESADATTKLAVIMARSGVRSRHSISRFEPPHICHDLLSRTAMSSGA